MLTDVQARRNPTNVITWHYIGLNRCYAERGHVINFAFTVRSRTSFSRTFRVAGVYDVAFPRRERTLLFYRMRDDARQTSFA